MREVHDNGRLLVDRFAAASDAADGAGRQTDAAAPTGLPEHRQVPGRAGLLRADRGRSRDTVVDQSAARIAASPPTANQRRTTPLQSLGAGRDRPSVPTGSFFSTYVPSLLMCANNLLAINIGNVNYFEQRCLILAEYQRVGEYFLASQARFLPIGCQISTFAFRRCFKTIWTRVRWQWSSWFWRRSVRPAKRSRPLPATVWEDWPLATSKSSSRSY